MRRTKAQLAVQRTPNPPVVGSSPTRPAIHPEDLLLGSAGVMDTYEWAKAIQQSKDLVRMLSDKDGDD